MILQSTQYNKIMVIKSRETSYYVNGIRTEFYGGTGIWDRLN